MQAIIRLFQYKIIFQSFFQYVLCTSYTPSYVAEICTQGKCMLI